MSIPDIEKLTPAQRGVETRAANKKAEYMLTNKMLQNAFILRQSILSEIGNDNARNIDEECGYPTVLEINDYQKFVTATA